jgi:uncharacterized membrane protein (DUF485 family)
MEIVVILIGSLLTATYVWLANREFDREMGPWWRGLH